MISVGRLVNGLWRWSTLQAAQEQRSPRSSSSTMGFVWIRTTTETYLATCITLTMRGCGSTAPIAPGHPSATPQFGTMRRFLIRACYPFVDVVNHISNAKRTDATGMRRFSQIAMRSVFPVSSYPIPIASRRRSFIPVRIGKAFAPLRMQIPIRGWCPTFCPTLHISPPPAARKHLPMALACLVSRIRFCRYKTSCGVGDSCHSTGP